MFAVLLLSFGIALGGGIPAHAVNNDVPLTPQAKKMWEKNQEIIRNQEEQQRRKVNDMLNKNEAAQGNQASPPPVMNLPTPKQRPAPQGQQNDISKNPGQAPKKAGDVPVQRKPTPLDVEQTDLRASPDAQRLAASLKAVGFNCHLADPTSPVGYNCVGKVSGYPKSVNIYFPRYLSGAKAALAYHFHGIWWGGRDAPMSPFSHDNGDFGAYIVESKKDLVLIAPECPGGPPVFMKDLSTADQVNSFFKSVDTLLSAGGMAISDSTPVVISGHSNAYGILGQLGAWGAEGHIPRLKSLYGFGLLDSAYGYRTGLVQMRDVMKKSGHMLYFAPYNSSPGNEEQNNKIANYHRIKAALGPDAGGKGSPQYVFVADPRTAHMQFMKKYIADFWRLALP